MYLIIDKQSLSVFHFFFKQHVAYIGVEISTAILDREILSLVCFCEAIMCCLRGCFFGVILSMVAPETIDKFSMPVTQCKTRDRIYL
jgi:hypothetical protein